jgi:ABC-type proline/glycine betaine transport system permease subunit
VVLVIVGGFFILATYWVQCFRAGGLAQVFSAVRQQVFGSILLGVIAVGLFAFGVYGLLEAVNRRVDVPEFDSMGALRGGAYRRCPADRARAA